MALIAPSVVILCKACLCQGATTTGSSSSSSSLTVNPDVCFRMFSLHVVRGIHSALSALPSLCRISMVHSPFSHALSTWLCSRAQQQQQLQLLDAFSSSEDLEWFLWNRLAAAVGHLHRARNGRSEALGRKALKAQAACQWGPLGDLGDLGDDVFVPHLRQVLGCLRALYLLVPSNSCLDQLHCFQQQQQQDARGVEGVAAPYGAGSISGGSPVSSSSSGVSSGSSISTTWQAETGSSSKTIRGGSSKEVNAAGAAGHGHLAAAASGGGRVDFDELMDRMSENCSGVMAPGCLWLLPPQSGSVLEGGSSVIKCARGPVGEGAGRATSAEGEGLVESKQAGGRGKRVTGGAGLTLGKACARLGLGYDAFSFGHLELVLNGLLLSWPSSGKIAGAGGAAALGRGGILGGQPAGAAASSAAADVMGGGRPGAISGRSASGGVGSSSSQAADQQTTVRAQQIGDSKAMGSSLSQQEQEFRRGALLLLAAFLQKAPAEAKQQLLQQHGSLLLQLLYRVLVDQEDMGGKEGSPATVLVSDTFFSDISIHLAEASAVECRSADRLQQCFLAAAGPMTMIQLVLMVLQGLLFVVDPWEAAGGAKQLLKQTLLMGLSEGEAGTEDKQLCLVVVSVGDEELVSSPVASAMFPCSLTGSSS